MPFISPFSLNLRPREKSHGTHGLSVCVHAIGKQYSVCTMWVNISIANYCHIRYWMEISNPVSLLSWHCKLVLFIKTVCRSFLVLICFNDMSHKWTQWKRNSPMATRSTRRGTGIHDYVTCSVIDARKFSLGQVCYQARWQRGGIYHESDRGFGISDVLVTDA